MADVISISSSDSDVVEVVDAYTNLMDRDDPSPLADLQIDLPQHFIDLTHPRWTLPELKTRKRPHSTVLEMVDLTGSDLTNVPEQETENLPPNDCRVEKDKHQKCSSEDPAVFVPQQDCGNQPKMRCLNSVTEDQSQLKGRSDSTFVSKTYSVIQIQFNELDASQCSVYLTDGRTKMLLGFRHPSNNDEEVECIDDLEMTALNGPRTDHSPNESHPKGVDSLGQTQQNNTNTNIPNKISESLLCTADSSHYVSDLSTAETVDFCSSSSIPLLAFPLSQHEAEGEVVTCNMEQMELDKVDTRQSWSYVSSPSSHLTQPCDLVSLNYKSQSDPISTSEQGNEDINKDDGFEMQTPNTEDRHFVCPVALQKRMSGPAPSLIDMEDAGPGAPVVLCQQSLSMVYSTIDEKHTEGTLQLLSTLIQPGSYPPKQITTHLLHDILLDPQCPYHLCEQAFKLLMSIQRYHMADKTTVPWKWELLTSHMDKQDHTKQQSAVVCMLLKYVMQTLWDDFQAKRFLGALHQSIAKATVSCDHKFHQVRDVIKWLFAVIEKLMECGESTTKEKDEQMRMVLIFQRMLSMSLEVDHSPTLSSARLSQELFHMLIGNLPSRAHRWLLLESLQSSLLRCKLLEHLLDYACPLKTPLPMSLSLLLHFLKNCSLPPDPMDGTERWHRWEELVRLLWMLLLSYNKTLKGYLCSVSGSGRVGTLVYKAADKVSTSAVREATEAFLSRSQADLGQALPQHVGECLIYLQNRLLDVCQC